MAKVLAPIYGPNDHSGFWFSGFYKLSGDGYRKNFPIRVTMHAVMIQNLQMFKNEVDIETWLAKFC